ncbi:MAG: hypothetical protein CMM10_07165, partial [Rhodospirillaceae bacterium]|nr:hypothetical protein [Rhodospirillaceae bacterium]
MVVWSLRIIDRFGKLVVTIAVTILVVLASFAVTYFDSILFDHKGASKNYPLVSIICLESRYHHSVETKGIT